MLELDFEDLPVNVTDALSSLLNVSNSNVFECASREVQENVRRFGTRERHDVVVVVVDLNAFMSKEADSGAFPIKVQ